MSEEDPAPKRGMSTTQVMRVTEELKDALGAVDITIDGKDGKPDIMEAKLPAKAVAALVVWIVTQVLTMSGIYYDLRGEVHSLQQTIEGLEDVVEHKDLETIRMELGNIKESVREVEKDLESPPTNMDHMRVIGDLRIDLRVLEQRVSALEGRRSGRSKQQ